VLLKSKQIRKSVAFPFYDTESSDEWITKEGDNVEVSQTQGKGDGGYVDLA